MATYQNVTTQTIKLEDLNGLTFNPGQQLSIPDEIGEDSWSLASALQQGGLVLVDGGSWPFEGGRFVTSQLIQPAGTLTPGSSGETNPFWTGIYDVARIYWALSSGDLTWTYQSSPDGGGSWFNNAEFVPVTLTATTTPESVVVTNLGAMGRITWSTVNGAVCAAKVVLKT